ncbi:hypothetical protein ACFW16_34045 [Inquilinus sp. NPDC058860]|uniref:hypothetical protein n=1 Tax=Inquilinus sp. NPDC058860 TaxID=3346652 RepID=UPI00367E85D2
MPGVGTNRYAYSDNDPINKSDPSGHMPVRENPKTADKDFFRSQREQGLRGGPYDSREERQRIHDVQLEAHMDSAVNNRGEVVSDIADVVQGAILASRLPGAARIIGQKARKNPNASEETETSLNFTRDLTVEDLGIVGSIDKLSGTLTVENGVATVRIDMIQGTIRNSTEIVGNLQNLARANGASTLNIQGSLANERLYDVLSRRYGLTTQGGLDTISIPLD